MITSLVINPSAYAFLQVETVVLILPNQSQKPRTIGSSFSGNTMQLHECRPVSFFDCAIEFVGAAELVIFDSGFDASDRIQEQGS